MAIECACQAKHDRPPCGRLDPLESESAGKIAYPTSITDRPGGPSHLPFAKFLYEVGLAAYVGEAEITPEVRIGELGVVQSE